MADPVRALEVLTRLRTMGVPIVIDDFGAGHTSLGYLKRLPVDALKIDKSFVKDMVVDASDAAIVRSIIDLSHHLGLKVVAEGVEDQATWEMLQRLGCDAAQGYHLGPPLDAVALLHWLAHSPWAPAAAPRDRA